MYDRAVPDVKSPRYLPPPPYYITSRWSLNRSVLMLFCSSDPRIKITDFAITVQCCEVGVSLYVAVKLPADFLSNISNVGIMGILDIVECL